MDDHILDIPGAPTWQLDPPALRTMSFAEFISHRAVKPPQLLSPWLYAGNLVMISAESGLGKTHFALEIASTVASGGEFLGFKAANNYPVLYIDAEMPEYLMQEWLIQAEKRGNRDLIQKNFRIFCSASDSGDAPDISLKSGQDFIDRAIGDAKLVILDNLSVLSRTGRPNDAESWRPINQWLINLRKMGIAVIIIHHDNKSGHQMGTNAKIFQLDTVIHLKKPFNYQSSEGVRFELHYDKKRHFFGKDAEPFEAILDNNVWQRKPLRKATMADAISLKQQGHSLRDIEELTGISKSKISRHLNGGGELCVMTVSPVSPVSPVPPVPSVSLVSEGQSVSVGQLEQLRQVGQLRR